MHNDISKWLSDQLQQSNLGVNQLGKYSGVAPSMISNVINGKRIPSPKTVSKLAQHFKVDEDWLLMLAGHRTAKGQEKKYYSINDPELRIWATPENLDKLSKPVKQALIALIKTDLEISRKMEMTQWVDESSCNFRPIANSHEEQNLAEGNGKQQLLSEGTTIDIVTKNPEDSKEKSKK